MTALIGPPVALTTPTGHRVHQGTALVEHGVILGYTTLCGRTFNGDTTTLLGLWDARPADAITCERCDR